MKKPKFGVGMKVILIGIPDPYTDLNGGVCEVVGGFGKYLCRYPDGSQRMTDCYKVQHENGATVFTFEVNMILCPPANRGDLDIKVAWKDMPYQRRPEDL